MIFLILLAVPVVLFLAMEFYVNFIVSDRVRKEIYRNLRKY